MFGIGRSKTKKKSDKLAKALVAGRDDVYISEVPANERVSKKDSKTAAKKPSYSYLVTMLYSNGKKKTFVVASKKETFKHGGRTYYLRYEDSYYDVPSGMHELIYHDDHPVPISREIDVDKGDPYFNVKSSNIKELLDMEYVKVLASSHELSKYVKYAAIVGLVSAMASILCVFFIYRLASAQGVKIL